MPIPHLRQRTSSAWRDHSGTSALKTTRSSRKKPKIIKKLLKLAILAALFLFLCGAIYVAVVSRNLPNPNQLLNREVAQSTKIYDRTGENLLYEISGNQKRTLVALNDIPVYVKQATIAIEDKNFYEHGAFSIWAMIRTAITNVIFNRSAGGSTLTQQFVKNAVLTPEKTITRKIKELVVSYRLEQKFSKDEILQMYLNEIPYGSTAYGVEAASQKYFGKSVKDVSLAEAATLAAIVQAPSRYSPYGPNKDTLLGRKDYVLGLMAEQGYISETERDAAKAQEIKFSDPDATGITAPHFVMYIKDLLAEKYGEKMIEQEGLKIYTTLDLYKQKIAEEVIAEKTKNYQDKYDASNASLVAIDPKTGQVLAMVGSRDFFDEEIDGQVNVAISPRQPGSSMKPIVYAALFERGGYNPNTILYDVVTNFSTNPADPYEPHNYNGKELGPVTIRQALAGSLNIPAVKAIYLADINNVLDLADNLNYTTLYPRSRFGLSLVLGGGEVKLLEHVNAYSAFARDGIMSPVVSILKVEDKNGKVIEEYRPTEKKVLSSQVARMINSVLSDNNARTYIFGAKSALTLGDRPVAAKSGTTNDYHDAWTVGYTPSLVAGVWVGNSDNKKMKRGADGSILAAPIWHDFMAKVLGDTPVETFKEPETYVGGKAILDGTLPGQSIKIDIRTGLLATESTPAEFVKDESSQSHHNILYYVDRNDPTGPAPVDPSQDPQFALWESAVQRWAASGATSTIPFTSSGATITNSVGASSSDINVKIISPSANQTISSPLLEIQASASATNGVGRIEYYLNDNLLESLPGGTTGLTKDISFLNNGYQSLKARACDVNNNCAEDKIDFNLSIPSNLAPLGKNSLKIVSPLTGVALSISDFPLLLDFSASRPGRTAQVVLFARDSKGAVKEEGKTNELRDGNFSLSWGPAASGEYSLYAVLYDWNGDIINSNEIKANVQ